MAELMPSVDDVCTYNGVTFGPKMETLAVSIVPVPDGSGRTVAFNRYTITIKSWVYNEPLGTADDDMPDLRTRLTEYGKELHYENKGLGGFVINLDDGSGTRDVLWGPKPTLLKFKPVGASKVAEIEWTVEVHIPDCERAKYEFRLMEFVFRLAFNIDNSGYTRRTYSGYIRIPQTHPGGAARGRVIDSADRYRDRIYPKPLPGFRRLSADFPLSEDHSRLDYTIVDEEMSGNIPPPGIVNATARHTVGTNKFIASTTLWNGTIAGSYEVVRGGDKILAARAFTDLLTERRDIIEREAMKAVLINSLQMEEPEIYGKLTANFTATYMVVVSRKVLLEASGLWRPLGNSDWTKWAISLKDSIFHERGNAKLRHLPADDIIIDLCTDEPAKPASPKASGKAGITTGKSTLTTYTNDTPPPGSSWVRYRSRIRVETVDEAVELKELPSSALISVGGGVSGSAGGSVGVQPRKAPPQEFRSPPDGEFVGRVSGPLVPLPSAINGPASNPPRRPGSVPAADVPDPTPSIQTRCRPTVAIYLEGEAVRAGYPVIPPTLVKVGSYKAVPANRPGNGFVQEVATSWFGVPIYVARWSFRWLVEGLPATGVPLPANPLVEV